MEHVQALDCIAYVAIKQLYLDIFLEGEGDGADHVNPLRFAAMEFDVVVGELEYFDFGFILELDIGGEGEHAGVDDGDELVEHDALVPHLGLSVLVVQLH